MTLLGLNVSSRSELRQHRGASLCGARVGCAGLPSRSLSSQTWFRVARCSPGRSPVALEIAPFYDGLLAQEAMSTR